MGVHLMDKVIDGLCETLQANFQERWIDQRMLDDMELEVKKYFIKQFQRELIGHIPNFKIIAVDGEAPIVEISDEELYRMVYQGLVPTLSPQSPSKK